MEQCSTPRSGCPLTILMNKGIKILLVIFLVLVGVLSIQWYLNYQAKRARRKNPYAAIDLSALSKFIIQRPGETYTFEKRLDYWEITHPLKYKACPEEIDKFLTGFKELTIGEIVSSREEKQRDYEVDQQEGVYLKVYKNKEKEPFARLILGKPAFDYLHHYLRFPGELNIYLSRGIDWLSLQRDIKEWMDKTIFSLKRDKIEQIRFAADKKEAILRPGEKEWEMIKADTKLETRPEKTHPILNILCELKADDFVSKDEESDTVRFGFDRPSWKIFVKLTDRQETLFIGRKTGQDYYLKKKDIPTVFLVKRTKISALEESGLSLP